MHFDNGLALADGALLVTETEVRRVSGIRINTYNSAGPMSTLTDDLPDWPDDLALDDAGRAATRS